MIVKHRVTAEPSPAYDNDPVRQIRNINVPRIMSQADLEMLHEKLQTVLFCARSAPLSCSLKFLLDRTSLRAWRAMIIATQASILRDDFGLSLAILIPQRFGLRRAFMT